MKKGTKGRPRKRKFGYISSKTSSRASAGCGGAHLPVHKIVGFCSVLCEDRVTRSFCGDFGLF